MTALAKQAQKLGGHHGVGGLAVRPSKAIVVTKTVDRRANAGTGSSGKGRVAAEHTHPGSKFRAAKRHHVLTA